MPEDGDLKNHALNSSHDFYDLLSIPSTAQAQEIRRAYRKTAPKYHPDKVGNDPIALEKFYLVQIAYDVLSDTAIRELYDNARNARLAKVEREKLFEGRRKAMKEDLERREGAGLKRRRVVEDEEEVFARELRRLAEDGKRRRKEREEVLRREAEEIEDEIVEKDGQLNALQNERGQEGIPDIDRSITLRYPQTPQTEHLTDTSLRELFTRFGAISEILLREKKLKSPGEKHRKPYIMAVIVYQSIVGAHAAVTDFPARAREDQQNYGVFEGVDWAGGKEPDFVPKVPERPAQQAPPKFDPDNIKPAAASSNGDLQDGGKKAAPSFGSFKGGSAGKGGPSLDEVTMMRLKNAERRRMEEKIRKEEEAAAATEGDGQLETEV